MRFTNRFQNHNSAMLLALPLLSLLGLPAFGQQDLEEVIFVDLEDLGGLLHADRVGLTQVEIHSDLHRAYLRLR